MARLLLPPAAVRPGVPVKPAKREREEGAESLAMSEAATLKPKEGDPSAKEAVAEKYPNMPVLLLQAGPLAAPCSATGAVV